MSTNALMNEKPSTITKEQRIFLCSEDNITLYENNLVTLTLSDGKVYEALEPRRLFPVNAPNEYITLLNGDNSEVAIIRNICDLNKESKATVLNSLNDYYLIPVITRIISTSEKYGTLHWCVETDRGIKEFDIRNRNTDIKVQDNGHIRVRDLNDNRYIIDNYNKLDPHSKKLLIVDI